MGVEQNVQHSLAVSALASVLTLLPELLDMWERYRSREAPFPAQHTALETDPSTGGRASGEVPHGPQAMATLMVSMPTMACSACVNKVGSSIRTLRQVVHAKVELGEVQGGFARICVRVDARRPAEAFPNLEDAMCALREVVERAGFRPDQVEVVKRQGSSETGTVKVGRGDTSDRVNMGIYSRVTAIVGGLLGSSCCAIQLVLHALARIGIMSGACAGFNSALGPSRSVLRAATAFYVGMLWILSLRRGSPLGPLIRTSTLALALTFMPEALRLMSRSPLSPFGISALAAPTDGAVTHEIRLDGMSCEACEVYVRQVLQRQSGIVGVTHTDYEAGLVHVVGNPLYGFNITETERTLAENGYETLSARELD